MADVSNDLIVAMNDPRRALYSDEFVVIIADKYPKSVFHYLVMPREDIPDVRSLKAHHIPKLIYMELKGLEFAIVSSALHVDDFLVGYHAYPSMNRLHLHVLSKDFRSIHLRHSYQWNSFHTEFLVTTSKIIMELHTLGHVQLPPNKKCLQQKLYCHKCNFNTDVINSLRLHLSLFHR